uniref:PDZ domain-containing protein n=1 Tax=Callorhinchus milii TaxID=7868 RepID=A0A4W3HUI5_CALMI
FNGNTGSLLPSLFSYPGDAGIQLVNITKTTGLGLVITGGANRPDGPNVFVEDVVSGGDCHRDGRLRPGDQLIAINKKSLIGVTLEDAQTILNKINFRWESALCDYRGYSNNWGCSRWGYHGFALYFTFANGNPLLLYPAATPSAQKEAASSKQKVSLDPHVRLKMDKLDLALMYLGLDVTEERRRELKQSLTADSQGTVAFGGKDNNCRLDSRLCNHPQSSQTLPSSSTLQALTPSPP